MVLEGLTKVFTRVEEKELLLYYIKPTESCVMSFSVILNTGKSRLFVSLESDSTVLLLPQDKLQGLIRAYPA